MSNHWFITLSKPLLFLMRSFGICPWYTKEHQLSIYSISIKVLISLFVLGTLTLDTLTYVDALITTNQPKLQLTFVALLFIIFQLFGLLYILVLSVHAKRLPLIIDALKSCIETVHLTDKRSRRYVIASYAAFTASVFCISYIQIIRIPRIWHNITVVFGLQFSSAYATIFQTLSLTLISGITTICLFSFGFLSATIGFAFKEVEVRLARQFRGFQSKHLKYELFALEVLNCRSQHFVMSSFVAELDDIFASVNLIGLTYEVIVVILLISGVMGATPVKLGYMFSNSFIDQLFLLFWAFWNFYLLAYRMVTSAYVHNKAQAIGSLLTRISEDVNDNELGRQVVKTLHRLQFSPVEFTAGKIFRFNTELILSVAGIFVTYLIVVQEMNSRDDRSQMSPWSSAACGCNFTVTF